MKFLGLLGERLGHSLSPEIHKSIFKNVNIEGAYELFEIPPNSLEDFTKATKLLKVQGFNVTIPYKEKIMNYLDEISDEAKRIGAVNTVVLKENKLYGYNTDYFGIDAMLKNEGISVNGKDIVILGTGGACKAMLTYVLDNNSNNIYIVSRNPKIVDLDLTNNKVKVIDYEELESIKGDIIVNTTPVGMYPNVNKSPVGKEIVNNYNIVIDLIYNPLETVFLKYGRECGKKTISGLYMLVGQAIKAEAIFNDIKINNRVMYNVYKELYRTFSLREDVK